MIHLQRTGDNNVPCIECDSCGAFVVFHTTLLGDPVLTADDHAGMRAAVERMGWRYMVNVTRIGPSEFDVCGRCLGSKVVVILQS